MSSEWSMWPMSDITSSVRAESIRTSNNVGSCEVLVMAP